MTFQSVGGKKAEKEPRKTENKTGEIKKIQWECRGQMVVRGTETTASPDGLMLFHFISWQMTHGAGGKNTMILGLFIIRGHFLIACFLLKIAALPLRTISSGDWAFGSISPQISTCSFWDMSSSLLKLTPCFTCTCHFWSPHMIRSTLHFKYSWGWVTEVFSNKAEC